MSEPIVKFTLDVTADSESVLAKWAAKFLADLGYYIVPPGKPWEKSSAFCKRVGILRHQFAGMVARFEARGGSVRLDRRGSSRRIMAIQVNPDFERFCKATKKQA